MATKKLAPAESMIESDQSNNHEVAISASPHVRTDDHENNNVAASAEKRHVVAFENLSDITRFAITLGVELSGSLQDRANRAADHLNASQKHMLAGGVLLLSIKAECEHGQFLAHIAQQGFEARTAQRAMQYAQFVLQRPESERELLCGMRVSQVLLLANADPEVVDALNADAEIDLTLMTVRALKQRIKDLEAANVDTTAQRDAAEVEAEGLRKRLAKQPSEREDKVPMVVADLRAELLAMGKKAELSITSIASLGADLDEMVSTASNQDWADATARLAVSQLGALRLQIDGVIGRYLNQLPDADPTPEPRSYLTKQEVLETAQAFAALAQTHDYEAAMREWERAQERPRGKGRPTAKPVAPGGAA